MKDQEDLRWESLIPLDDCYTTTVLKHFTKEHLIKWYWPPGNSMLHRKIQPPVLSSSAEPSWFIPSMLLIWLEFCTPIFLWFLSCISTGWRTILIKFNAYTIYMDHQILGKDILRSLIITIPSRTHIQPQGNYNFWFISTTQLKADAW